MKGCGKEFKTNIRYFRDVSDGKDELFVKDFRSATCGEFSSIGNRDPLNQRKSYCKECCPQDVEVIIKPCPGDQPTIGWTAKHRRPLIIPTNLDNLGKDA